VCLSDNKAESDKLTKLSSILGYQQRKTVAHVLNMRGTFKQVYVESSQDEAKRGEVEPPRGEARRGRLFKMNPRRSEAR
jgi:hypothetical protein